MTDKLKPCPFCLSRNVKIFVGLSEFHDGEIHCKNCGASSGNKPTKSEAITAWNTRAADALEPSGDVVESLIEQVGEAMKVDPLTPWHEHLRKVGHDLTITKDAGHE